MSNLFELIKFSLCITVSLGDINAAFTALREVRKLHAKHVDTKCYSQDAMILVFSL